MPRGGKRPNGPRGRHSFPRTNDRRSGARSAIWSCFRAPSMRVCGDVRTCPGPKAARPRRRLLRETFGLQGFVHLRASAHTSLIGRDIRIGFEINPDEIRPVYYGEGVRIGDGEGAPQQVLPVRELVVEIR